MKKIFFSSLLFVFLASTINAQTMRIGGQAELGLPIGDFSETHSMGFGAHVSFIYLLKNNLEITGLFGYTTFGAASDLPEGFDYSLSTIPLLGGMRYKFGASKTFIPYAGAELGLHFLSATVTVEYSFMGDGEKREVSSSDTEFGFSPMGGFYYSLSPDMLLDVNLKFNIISDANYLGLNAGLLFRI